MAGLSRDEQFFYDHAGWSYPTTASLPEASEQERQRNAHDLAAAERLLIDGPHYFVAVEPDGQPYDGDARWDGPVWVVGLYAVQHPDRPVLVGSVAGVACGAGDPHLRVVGAELALQYLAGEDA